MDIEILELCKENIQPLRKGRKANQLGLALKAEGNAEIQTRLLKEREEYELGIITYDGPDPLLPRLEYITWLEQTYIKHGRECNLIPLLEDTITVFKDNPKYKQDPRFIDLVVKYVEAQDNAVELFQMVYSQGLGTMCASLYRSWAEVLDQGNDFKRADQVYQLGIANHAEPVDMLKQAHAQFQLSVGRRMMITGDLSQPLVDEAPERQALGKLKKGVGSIRAAHGSAGVLSVKSSSKSSSKKTIPVFQDGENNYEHLISVALQKNKLASIATSSKNNEENTVKPGTWNKGYNRKEVSKMISMPPTTPSFKVHVDPEAETETPKLVAKTPYNVLKTRKTEMLASSNAKEVFTSSSSAHKPLQANLGVYAGGREFSFEELRAAYYKKQEDIKNSKKEALAQLQTPAKYLIPLNMPTTPFTMGNTCDECETPLASMRNLSISSESKDPHGIQNRNDSPQTDTNEACFKTPFKHPTGFVPITPSLQGIDLSEFIETPTPVQPTQPKNNKVFSIFVDEECSSSTSSKNLLPIIEENQEGENKTSPKIVKKGFVRKKQLFSED